MDRKPIVNSDLIGEKLTIQLPGFPHGKQEKCSIRLSSTI